MADLFHDELMKPEISKQFSNIVFVAHSLGGVVLKSLLNRSSISRDALNSADESDIFLWNPRAGSVGRITFISNNRSP